MKILMKLTLIAFLLSNVWMQSDVPHQPDIDLVANDQIEAGETWSMRIVVFEAEPEIPVDIVVMNGVQVNTESVMLNGQNEVIWEAPVSWLTSAGTTQIIVQHGDAVATHQLTISAVAPSQLFSFPLGNSITAYGEGNTNLVILAYDDYGNPIDAYGIVRITYPDGMRRLQTIIVEDGFAQIAVMSQGEPGILRLATDIDGHTHTTTLVQQPSIASNIAFTITPDCVLSDGRDSLTLGATVTDAYGFAVADGTIVTFRQGESIARGVVFEGQALVNLPALTEPGTYTWEVSVGQAFETAILRVTDGVCP
jgi:hypothetical protein